MAPGITGCGGMSWLRLVWLWTLAVLLRLALAAVGLGDALLWRPEVSTPANSALQAREGVRLLQLGVSPYAGASCHAPPLWLVLVAPVVNAAPWLRVLPNVACDLAGAAALLMGAAAAHAASTAALGAARDDPWLSPAQLSVAYLFAPPALLSCVAGTSTSAESAAILVALAGGVSRNGPAAGIGLGLAAYMSPHLLLLLAPLLLLMWYGPEDMLRHLPPTAEPLAMEDGSEDSLASKEAGNKVEQDTAVEHNTDPTQGMQGSCAVHDSSSALPTEGSSSGIAGRLRRRHAGGGGGAAAAADGGVDRSLTRKSVEEMREPAAQQRNAAQGSAAAAARTRVSCLLIALAATAACLLLLSDAALESHPEDHCLPVLTTAAANAGAAAAALPAAAAAAVAAVAAPPQPPPPPRPPLLSRRTCWAARVYGLQAGVTDLTPNIGLAWYFFTEMFERNRYFFLFVFHSFPAALALPLALRWPRRPLLVATAQLIVCGAFKPYACLGDAGAWLGVLPLLQQQLGMLRAGPGLAYAALLLAVLSPSMWHMWIIADSANSNFFYSITLLVGVWHALLLVQLLRLSALADRRLRTSTAAVAWGRAAKSE